MQHENYGLTALDLLIRYALSPQESNTVLRRLLAFVPSIRKHPDQYVSFYGRPHRDQGSPHHFMGIKLEAFEDAMPPGWGTHQTYDRYHPHGVIEHRFAILRIDAEGHEMLGSIAERLRYGSPGSQIRTFDSGLPSAAVTQLAIYSNLPQEIASAIRRYELPSAVLESADMHLQYTLMCSIRHVKAGLAEEDRYHDVRGRLDLSTPLWAFREAHRLFKGEYTPIPTKVNRHLPDASWLRYIPHMAMKDSNRGNIAYTENDRAGWNDRQATMRPGRWLRRLGKVEASDQQVKEWAAEVLGSVDYSLHKTDEAEMFAHVYMEGPSSCMAYGKSKFGHTCIDDDGEFRHPAEVYAHPDNDIELWWIEINERIVARALVNTDSLEYPSIYGSDMAPAARRFLEAELERAGYEQHDSALDGQRLLRIPVRGGLLCPYIDSGGLSVRDEGDSLVIDIHGDLVSDHSTGCAGHPKEMYTCYHCDGDYDEDEDDPTYVNDEPICPHCINNHYTRGVDRYDDIEWMLYDETSALPSDISRQGESTDRAHDDCKEDQFIPDGIVWCIVDDEYIDIDDAHKIVGTNDWVSDDYCADVDNYDHAGSYEYTTVEDGTCIPSDKAVFDEDSGYWMHEDDIEHEAEDIVWTSENCFRLKDLADVA